MDPALDQNQFPEAFTDHLVPSVWSNPQSKFSPRLGSGQEQSRLCYIPLPPVHSHHISTPWPSLNPSSQGTHLCWKYFLNKFFHFSTTLQCTKPSFLYYSTWPSSQACEICGAGISIPSSQMRRLRHGTAKCRRLRGTAAQSKGSVEAGSAASWVRALTATLSIQWMTFGAVVMRLVYGWTSWYSSN